MVAPSITQLLGDYRAGDASALDRAFAIVYDDLRRLASRQLRFGSTPTLNTTSLVHELYVKLVDRSQASPNDRGHFLALASRAMRQIIIDYARERGARKRGGGQLHVPLDSNELAVEDEAEHLLAVDEVLNDLKKLDERLVRVFECRFFAGLTKEETAEAIGVSVSTVQRDWKRARAWLKEKMQQ